jgi:GH18 family chitinase
MKIAQAYQLLLVGLVAPSFVEGKPGSGTHKHLCEDIAQLGCLHLFAGQQAESALKQKNTTQPAKKHVRGHQVVANTPGYQSSSYYTNWKTYYGYDTTQIPIASLTRINYAFIQIGNCAPPYGEGLCNKGSYATGEQNYQAIYSTDPWSDFNTVPADYYHAGESGGLGNMARVINLMHSQSKPVIASLGGYTLSSPINEAIKPENREGFVAGVERFFDQVATDNNGVPFDGLDIDWEPNNAQWSFLWAEGAQTILQNMLDTAKLIDERMRAKYGSDFLLTVAWPASPDIIAKAEAVMPGFWQTWADHLDGMNGMNYDYHGDFDSPAITNFNAPAYYDPAQPADVSNREIFNDQSSLEAYQAVLNLGASGMQKLNLGLPIYGRGLAGMSPGSEECPGTYQIFSHSWVTPDYNDGMFSHEAIEAMVADGTLAACYVQGASQWTAYGQSGGENVWVSFDRKDQSVDNKINFVDQYGLNGVFSWEIAYDPEGIYTDYVYDALFSKTTAMSGCDRENAATTPSFWADKNAWIGIAAGVAVGAGLTFFAQKKYLESQDNDGYSQLVGDIETSIL